MDSFFEVHCRYQGYRDAAYHRTWELWSKVLGPDIKVLPLGKDSLFFWEVIWPLSQPHTDGGFDWKRIYSQIWNKPNRFDIAIWQESILCGIAMGHVSPAKREVCIRLLEAWSLPTNPLKGYIAPITFTAVEFYGRIFDSQLLKIKDPALGAIPYYEKLGFSLAEPVDGSTYYAKEIKQ